ncbi:MAG: hypothetical protein J4N92_00760, partial [Chloroflexi bacterium]|nr:hypothetical protein [Chloroflexota bacterium]
LYARGGHGVGHTFFVKDGKLQFDYNALGRHHRAVGDAKLAPGAHRLEARFDRGQPSGTLTIAVDGTDVGSVEVSPVVRMLGSTGMDLGQNPLSPVVDDYEPPFAFTGRLEKVTFRLRSARQAADVAAKARADLATE